MDPANRQQSVRSATRFLITLSESNPRETVVQIYECITMLRLVSVTNLMQNFFIL